MKQFLLRQVLDSDLPGAVVLGILLGVAGVVLIALTPLRNLL